MSDGDVALLKIHAAATHEEALQATTALLFAIDRVVELEAWAKQALFELRAGPSAQCSRLIREGDALLKPENRTKAGQE